MATIEEDLSEGLSITQDGNRYIATRHIFAKDLSGGSPFETFASALSLPGMPQYGDTVTVAGRTLYCVRRVLRPWPPKDADVLLTYRERPGGTVGGVGEPTQIHGGVVLVQEETDFDYENLAKPLANRVPITVSYDATSTGAPGSSAMKASARVPIFVPKASITYTRIEGGDPTDVAIQVTGFTNQTTWKGLAPNVALMYQVLFSSPDNGETWEVSYTVAIDKVGKWKQGARYRFSDGRYPDLTSGQIAAGNGYREVTVQGEYDFNLLVL